MPPRKRKKKAAAAKKEEGEEPIEAEAEAEEPAAKKQETEAGEEPALVHVVSSSEPAPAAPAPPLDAEVASLLARPEAVAPQPSVAVAAAAPPQPSVVSAPPQPSYHAQLAQARAQPALVLLPPTSSRVARAITRRRHEPHEIVRGRPEHGHVQGRFTEYFGRFSAVHDAVIQKHRMTKQSRGFGFVTVASRKAADRILGQKHVVQGRTLNVTNCKGRTRAPRATSRA